MHPILAFAQRIWPLLAGNALVLFGVFHWNWRVAEVLLLFWIETAWIVWLTPIRAYGRNGIVGAIAQVPDLLGNCLFLAFHAVFLTGLLYGVDWDKAVGGPAGWSAPSNGNPGDWFAAAWNDIPWLGVAFIIAFGIAGLFREWPSLLKKRTHKKVTQDKRDEATNGHVIVMHIGIILGGSGILAAGGDWGMLVVMIALKTAYEIFQAARQR